VVRGVCGREKNYIAVERLVRKFGKGPVQETTHWEVADRPSSRPLGDGGIHQGKGLNKGFHRVRRGRVFGVGPVGRNQVKDEEISTTGRKTR